MMRAVLWGSAAFIAYWAAIAWLLAASGACRCC
jgi:hypothetical protein